MIVAFDVDDTIYKVRHTRVRDGDCVYGCEKDNHECGNFRFDQIPDYDLIQVLRWFANNGDTVLVWSAGGKDYAQKIVEKLGLDGIVTVINKGKQPMLDVGICFDDMEVDLAKANVKVKR